jgi:hypothetical protein
VSVQYLSREWFDTANTPGFAAPYPGVGGESKARTLLDVGITVELTQILLMITAECKNCTMVNYGRADLLGFDYFNTPGTFDVRVGYRF